LNCNKNDSEAVPNTTTQSIVNNNVPLFFISVEIARNLKCAELTIIGSDSDIRIYKEKLMAQEKEGMEEIVLASSQSN